MAELFNRNITLSIYSVNNNKRVVFSSYDRNGKQGRQISFSISKSYKLDVKNAGTISITNPIRKELSLIIQSSSPNDIFYNVLAGYGNEEHFVSAGRILNTTYRHSGGDISVDLSVEEAHILVPWEQKSTIPSFYKAGTSLTHILTNEGIKIKEQIGNERQELTNIKIEDDFQMYRNKQQDLKELLEPHGYILVVDAQQELPAYQAFVYKNTTEIPETNVKYDTEHLTILNFKTGLLNAALEVSYNYEDSIVDPWLSFKSLFIPTIRPHTLIWLNEEKYDVLKGIYLVYRTNISLNSFSGNFSISGKALNIAHKSLVTGALRVSPERIRPFLEELKRRGYRPPKEIIQQLTQQGRN